MKKSYLVCGLTLLVLASMFGLHKTSVQKSEVRAPIASTSRLSPQGKNLSDAATSESPDSIPKTNEDPTFRPIEDMSTGDISEEIARIEDRMERDDVIRRFNEDSVTARERQGYSRLMSRLDDLKSRNLRDEMAAVEKALAAYEVEHGKKVDEMRKFLKQASTSDKQFDLDE